MATIPILVESAEDDYPRTRRGGILGGVRAVARATEVDVDKLRESFSRLSDSMAEVLRDVRRAGDFQLQTVQLQVEVTAEGGVQLVGTAKAGVKGAISLTFAAPEKGEDGGA